MPRDLFAFRWAVHPQHYRWVDTTGSGTTYARMEQGALVILEDQPPAKLGDCRALVYPSECSTTRSYEPLRYYPNLFRDFAEMDTTEEAIAVFANHYGSLTKGNLIAIAPHEVEVVRAMGIDPSDRSGDYTFVSGAERFREWKEGILDMRCAVFLWDLIRRQEGDGALRKHVAWMPAEKGGMRCLFRFDPATPWPRTFNSYPQGVRTLAIISPPPAVPSYALDDIHSPVIDHIAYAINSHLDEHVSPQVTWSEAGQRLELTFIPADLRGALWLQFAQTVDGNAESRPCRRCGRFFTVSLETSRSDRVFCSDACRTKAYRERKEQARQMFALGKSVKVIAKALDARADAVKGWVKGVQREE